MPTWNVGNYPIGLGWLIALIVLIIAIVLWVSGHAVTKDEFYGFIAALALARLV